MLNQITQHFDLTKRVGHFALELVMFPLHPTMLRDETFQRADMLDGRFKQAAFLDAFVRVRQHPFFDLVQMRIHGSLSFLLTIAKRLA